MQGKPLYRVGERVECRSHTLGTWRGTVFAVGDGAKMPTLSYGSGWVYGLSYPGPLSDSAGVSVWLPEECLAAWDEIGF